MEQYSRDRTAYEQCYGELEDQLREAVGPKRVEILKQLYGVEAQIRKEVDEIWRGRQSAYPKYQAFQATTARSVALTNTQAVAKGVPPFDIDLKSGQLTYVLPVAGSTQLPTSFGDSDESVIALGISDMGNPVLRTFYEMYQQRESQRSWW